MSPLFALALLFFMVALAWLSGLFARMDRSAAGGRIAGRYEAPVVSFRSPVPPQETAMYDRSDAQTAAHTESLIADLVLWVNAKSRTYDDTMTAWRTSCPRLTIWEDALDRGYVRRLPQGDGPARVVATDAGRAFLAARADGFRKVG